MKVLDQVRDTLKSKSDNPLNEFNSFLLTKLDKVGKKNSCTKLEIWLFLKIVREISFINCTNGNPNVKVSQFMPHGEITPSLIC